MPDLKSCFNSYCDKLVEQYDTNKVTKDNLIHTYYSFIVNSAANYDFEVPQNIKNTVKQAEGYCY